MGLKKDELKLLKKGEGCLGKAADDEPVFILRGQDLCAPHAIRTWVSMARTLGTATPDKLAEAEKCAKMMEAWPTRKVPA